MSDVAMTIVRDEAFAALVQNRYGEYLGSYDSEHKQVFIDLFQRGEMLVAYIRFAKYLKDDDITDRYYSALQDYARQHNFEGKLKVLYT